MKGFCCSLTAVALCLASYAAASPALPLFNIIRFQNEPCTISTTREGTCYTKAECENLGGTEGGDSCAEGFGVCCEFKVTKCGDTSRQNNTYIISSSASTTASTTCTYTVCPANENICRIKFEFTALTLATPALGTAGDAANADAGIGLQIGSCITDTFKISGGSGDGSPIICGTNTGQHMIMDSDGSRCHDVNFVIGSSTATTRSWDIHVTHHDCKDMTILENTAGPKGCLQYHLGSSTGTGRIDNFGFPGAAYPTALNEATTHLQNQYYSICIRRHGVFNRICYTVAYANSQTAATQGGFGLSLSDASSDTVAKSAVDTDCQTDYITIPTGMAMDQTVAVGLVAAVDKICGRYFQTARALETDITICSRSLPFVVGVNFDGSEVVASADMADGDEGFDVPSGFVGFHLLYLQDTST